MYEEFPYKHTHKIMYDAAPKVFEEIRVHKQAVLPSLVQMYQFGYFKSVLNTNGMVFIRFRTK